MDPQQRLLLQEVWRCIEDSGTPLAILQQARTAVYVGAMTADYEQDARADGEGTDGYSCSGTFRCMLANRVSHQFGLRGLSVAIDTACSSSLVALHEARRALLSGDCDYALVAGVNLNLHPWKYVSFSKARMLSPDGQCRTFDAGANGYVPGEGVAVLLLQSLEAAGRERSAHGILRGSAVNHGGRAASLTAPVVAAQREVITAAWESAGRTLAQCDYVEAHGTGTSLGDPIEVEALTQAFRAAGAPGPFCRLGSVKTNIGHLEAAAGLAGVIKVLLMMRAGTFVPTLNLQTLNPLIDLSRSPFLIAREVAPWPTREGRRLAGVSSFGFGGVNTHVVLESAASPPAEPATPGDVHFLPLSAATRGSLQALLQTWTEFAGTEEFLRQPLGDVARTLQAGRRHFAFRTGLLIRASAEAAAAFRTAAIHAPQAAPARVALRIAGGKVPPPAAVSASWAAAWSDCIRWGAALGLTLDVTGRESAAGPAARCREFALRYALGRHLLDAAPAIRLVAGEGEGFWAALAVAGLADGAEVMGRLGGAGPLRLRRPQVAFHDGVTGRTIAPFGPGPAYLGRLLDAVAAEVGGDPTLVPRARALFSNQFTFRRNLEAWDPALASRHLEMGRLLAEASLPGPSQALLELAIADALQRLGRRWQLTASLAPPPPATGEFLDLLEDGVLGLTEAVELVLDRASGLLAVADGADERWERIDPRKPYAQLRAQQRDIPELKEADEWIERARLAVLPARLEGESTSWIIGTANPGAPELLEVNDPAGLVRAAQAAWLQGADLDWSRLMPSARPAAIALPVYPFQGSRHWLGATEAPGAEGPDLTRVVDPGFDPAVRDHEIGGRRLLPAATLLGLGQELAAALGRPLVRDFEIRRPCLVDGPTRIEARVAAVAERFEIWGGGQLVATGAHATWPVRAAPPFDAEAWQAGSPLDRDRIYADFAGRGYRFGPSLQCLQEARATPAGVAFRVDPGVAGSDAENAADAGRDAVLQAALVAGWHCGVLPPGRYLPCAVEEFHLDRSCGLPFYAVAARSGLARSEGEFSASLELYAETGGSIGVLSGAVFRAAVPAAAPLAVAPEASSRPGNQAAVDVPRLQEDLVRWLSQTLLVEAAEFDRKADLRDYGLDSVGLTEYAEALEKELGVSVDTVRLFEHPTLAGLAAHLVQSHPAPLSQRYPLAASAAAVQPPAQVSVPPQLAQPTAAGADPVAVVGMAGRFPGCDDLPTFWNRLAAGADLVTVVPPDRWSWEEHFGNPQAAANRTHSKWGGFLTQVDRFDADFFRISPKEAAYLDPQQRLVLELAWQAVEDAGQSPASLRGSRTGVFVGVCNDDYRELIDRHAPRIEAQTSTGTYLSMVANRLSFQLDLHGPSEAIDTACSSSLVAVHHALRALAAGDCDQALVAGVNVCCTPRRHISFAHAGMLSADGRCKTFDAAADGYVRGEGAGVLFLKPLRAAENDRNPIHGLVRGSAVNHGGSANSLTAPNPTAQADLLVRAYRQAGIPVGSVSYIEAHGTGTALGDPIEFSALQTAFAALGAPGEVPLPLGSCRVGSVKTNIGHLESAAGIAGMIKVLLAFRHQQLPGIVHFRQLNPHIDLARGPFRVATQTEPWPAAPGTAAPRRAGVSSFGFGGVNAHVILEEAPATPLAPPLAAPTSYLIPLSAQSEERLEAVARDLGTWLARQPDSAGLMADLAYTLQVGRNALKARVAWVVPDRGELAARLAALGRRASRDRPPAAPAPETPLGDAPADRDFVRAVWAGGAGAARVARFWAGGSEIVWTDLYPSGTGRRISLPAYPFLAERHWISDFHPQAAVSAAPVPPAPVAPPAAARPVTRLIAGSDPLVRDHVVLGRPLLPGVASLSFAQAAGRGASASPRQISDLLWLRPVFVGDAGLVLRVRISPGAEGRDYQVVSGEGAAEVIHATGRFGDTATPATEVPIEEVRARCPRTDRPEAIYRTFSECGVAYGPLFKGLREIHWAESELIGRIEFPAEVPGLDVDLPPGLLDSAVQTVLWWMLRSRGTRTELYLPFSADRVDILRSPASRGYVHVVPVEINRDAGFGRFDLALTDETGRPWLVVSNFCVRRFTPGVAADAGGESRPSLPGEIFFRPVWRPLAPGSKGERSQGRIACFRTAGDGCLGQALLAAVGSRPVTSVYLGRKFDRLGAACFSIDAGQQADFDRVLREIGPCSDFYFLGAASLSGLTADQPAHYGARQDESVLGLFRLIKAIGGAPGVTAHPDLAVLTRQGVAVTHRDGELRPFAAATAALAQVAAREYPGWRVQVADFTDAEITASVAAWYEAGASSSGQLVAWRDGQPHARSLQRLDLGPSLGPGPLLRHGGTYLIVGGARGVGLETARLFAREASANLILVGRRAADAGIAAALAEITAAGGQAEYVQGDVVSPAAMHAAAERGRQRFGALHGVVHSAITLRDAPLARMDEADFLAAFRPKSEGVLALQAAVAGSTLDFFLVHSSVNSFWANAGQGNYVAACAFKDAAARRACGAEVRVINWGFWGETGIVSGGDYASRLAAVGILSLTNAQGAEALRRVLAAPVAQVAAARLQDGALAAMGFDPSRQSRLAAPALPGLGEALAAAVHAAKGLGAPAPLEAFFRPLADYGCRRLLEFLALQGQFQTAAPVSREKLRAVLGFDPARSRQFDALMSLLVEAGLLIAEGDCLRATEEAIAAVMPERRGRLADIRCGLAAFQPDAAAYLNLMDAAFVHFGDLCAGRVSPLEVLFPGGSSHLADAIYQHNGISDYFNGLVATAVRAAVAEHGRHEPARPLRLLEVGGGVGGTTSALLRILDAAAAPVEYCFTDLSPSLVEAARRRLGANRPWMQFKVADIEHDLNEAGIATGTYDLVVATNVLHATRDLAASIRKAKAALRRHGLLILNEVTGVQPYLTLTFGWLEGWRRYADAGVRLPHSPLVAPAGWRRLLEWEGFAKVAQFGDPAGVPGGGSVQTVFLAESDGLIEVPAQLPAVAPVAKAATPAEMPAAAAPNALLATRLAAFVGEATGRTPSSLAADARFVDLGVDSIVGIAIINRINRELGLKLKTSTLFNHTSLAELGAHIGTLGVVPPDRLVSGPASTPPAAGPPALSAPGAIAVIGMSGRFPGADDLEGFWHNLAGGVDAISEVPATRWGTHGSFFDPDREAENRSYLRTGGFLDKIEDFDPLFFDLSPREAELMDPQQRLFLEESWRAAEDAGYSDQRLAKARCGVFVGVSKGDYFDKLRGAGTSLNSHTWIGNETSILSARIAYHLNLKGPALPVDTACSSSLVALHLACQSIAAGDCDLALVGGVFLLTTSTFYVHTSKTLMLSPTGRCRAFDDEADGFVPGEGVAVVMLKPLAKALADGDRIDGVIAGSGVNQDGRTNGITAPNALSQRSLVEEVYRKAAVNPATVTYVEAHGTGTKLGDPIEVEALTAAFRAFTDRRQFCALGSVKTNIGHTATTAGVAGLIKVLLAMRHRQIPPSLNFRSPNAEIDFGASPFFVATTLGAWTPPAGTPRRGAVSSFGFSGTNAHVLVEEAPPTEAPEPPPVPCALFCLSAKTNPSLRAKARALGQWIEEHGRTASLLDVSFTLNSGRSHFKQRLACVAGSLPELRDRLLQWERDGSAAESSSNAGSPRTPGTPGAADLQPLQEARRAPGEGRKRALLAVAAAYASGASVDWTALHAGERGRILPLPGYPFDRQRCWPETLAGRPLRPDRSAVLLGKRWRPQPLESAPSLPDGGRWLLLAEGEPADPWGDLTRDPSRQWIRIPNQPRPAPGETEAGFPFDDWDAGERAAARIIANGAELRGIVHLGCRGSTEPGFEAVPRGTIRLLQRLLEHFGPRHLTVLQVTHGAEAFQNDAPSLAGGFLAGLVRTLGAEYRGLRTRVVDLDEAGWSQGAAIVRAELAAPRGAGEVCYRRGLRYGSELAELPPPPRTRPLPVLDAAKAYLITGGLGGLGAEAARWLVGRGARKLALLGRTALPPRPDWDGIVAEGTDPRLAAKIRLVAELEALGVLVLTGAPDLTEEAPLAAHLSLVRRRLGLVGGVIHCAGTVGSAGTAFLHKTAADMEAVWAPKVVAPQLLGRLLDQDPVEFFVLFSSVAGLIPELGVGAADYAAANAFMDRYAAWQHARGRRFYQTLAWPSWAEAGIGEVKGEAFQATGLLALTTAEGTALLGRSWTETESPSVCPAMVDRTRFSAGALAAPRAKAPPPQVARTVAPVGPAAAALRSSLVAFFSGQLKISPERFDPSAHFGEIGVDSVLLAELVRKLESVVGHPVDPSDLLAHPTVDALCAHLSARQPQPAATLVGTTVGSPRVAGDGAIAVIGLACRLPDAESPARFWELLASGRSSVREVPPERWDAERWYSRVPAPGRTTGKWAGFLSGIDQFDARYFGISDEAALQMDPLARLFLETGVQTFRDAGYSREELWNSATGVFVGARISNYAALLRQYSRSTVVGIGQNFIAAQLAQFHHLRGPNLVIDTACSSALVALHYACQSLRSGECQLALAGGVDLLLDEKIFLMLSEAGVLSPSGQCRTFDADANGYVPGEGAGAVLLKPLARALRDGDDVRAVILGSAVNNDGHTMGITTPSVEAQEELVRAALLSAGVTADTISYVEAHGTGTMIGDPIELRALTRAFAHTTTERHFCAVGSVKSNLGHLHSAAGIASTIKAILALQHRMLPPTLHCPVPNPRFDFGASPFFPQTELGPWEARQGVRRCGVSSFGFGGANCHVVLGEAPPAASPGRRRPPLPPAEFRRQVYWPGRPVTPAPTGPSEALAGGDGELDSSPLLVLEEVGVT